MSDPAVSPLTFAEQYDIFQSIFESLQDYEEKRLYNFVPRRILLSLCYANELVFPVPDPSITEVFLTTRKFIKNVSADVVTVVGNFVPWDFQSGIIYCCSNLELGYFLGKAEELGLPLEETDYGDWIDQSDPPQSYFWS